MLFLVIALLTLNLVSGSVHISMSEITDAFRGFGDPMKASIITDIRLPRVMSALILGGALAVAGYLLQTFFANPIAGPFVLGISSGAKLVVAMIMITFLSRGILLSSVALIGAAFLGSILSTILILIISKGVKNMSFLIVCGVMIGYICSSITEFVVTFADDSNIVNLHNWSMGSFSGTSNRDVAVMAVVVGITCIAVFTISKPMSAYQMGEGYAANMGVNVRHFRVLLILLSAVLSSCVTAFAGPISFVGVAVPHIIRHIYKTNRPIVMIPASFLGGAVFCLFADLIARNLFAPTELSISSVTAVFGAPIVVWMMIGRSRKESIE